MVLWLECKNLRNNICPSRTSLKSKGGRHPVGFTAWVWLDIEVVSPCSSVGLVARGIAQGHLPVWQSIRLSVIQPPDPQRWVAASGTAHRDYAHIAPLVRAN